MLQSIVKPNKEQEEAISKLNGPVMLLAGPGTGKTFTLVRRIKKMLEENINPSSILCLTFSEAAACEMKTRLIESIGTIAAGVYVSTYHSFCMDIIRQNRDEFELQENFQMADEVTKQAILKESIDEMNNIQYLKDKWGNKYFYISSIILGIETIKRERTTKEEFFSYIKNNQEWKIKLDNLEEELEEREKSGKPTKTCIKNLENQKNKIGKAVEFYSIYEIYSRKLSESGLIDYSDMINLVLDKMDEDEEFLKKVSSDFKYVLVDEYQDTSKVQNEIIFNILRGANTDNIFVVGDDDQIIYSFQGAKSSNLVDFLNVYPNTKIICLVENRRSTQTILDFASEIIKDDRFRITNSIGTDINKILIAKNKDVIKKEEKIKINIFPETVMEENFIVDSVQKLIKSGVKPSEIAIIARKNDYLENFARLLKQKSIPYTLQKQKNAFDIPSFIQAYFYLKLLVNSYLEQDKIFALLSGVPFKIEDNILAEILIKFKKENKNIIEIIENIHSSSLLENFYNNYIELKKKKSYTPLVQFIHLVLTKTGILSFYSNNKENRIENIQALKRLIDEANSYSLLHKGARIEDFITHLNTYFKQNIKLELEKSSYNANAVQLTTYHGSKGREFEHVFLPNLTSSVFEKGVGNNRELNLPIEKSVFSTDKELNTEAELLRLLFVGITRAKFGLYLSYANMKNSSPQVLSSYISKLFPKCDNLVEQIMFELDENAKTDEIVKNIVVQFEDNEFKNEIMDRIQNLTISQTSLNKYLNCPLQYFYSDILKIPVYVEDKDILEYGSSIHNAIQYMTNNALKNGYWGTKEDMYNIFLNAIEMREFTTFEKKQEFIERGKNAIENNFAKFTEPNPKNILSTEYRMETKFENVLLKGFADRISKTPNGEILIYDFKTGSYKKVKEDDDYYNQLRFYKFLYEEINPDKKVLSTSLVFFEEGCKESAPEFNTDSNNEIKEKIKKAIDNIKNLNFEPKEDKNICKYCNYKLICKLKCANQLL